MHTIYHITGWNKHSLNFCIIIYVEFAGPVLFGESSFGHSHYRVTYSQCVVLYGVMCSKITVFRKERYIFFYLLCVRADQS